jgi:alpha-D-xyloside xylohydrolase
MKFTDGYWQMRAGFEPNFAVQAYDIQADSDSLTVYAPTKAIKHRGDTLNLPMLTVRYSAPMEGVIRVQAIHHKGGKMPQPQFEIFETPVTPKIEITDSAAELTSGGLTVRVTRGDSWGVAFHAGAGKLTGSGWRALGFVDTPDGRYIHEQLDLGVGEIVYGLGERFTPFIKNGQVVDIWNEDGGTSSEQSYKNIPFYLTNRGYGVFVNHPERVSFEVGSEKVERVQFSVPGENLDYFVIYGPTPREILARYTTLTGRPALPPAWSFGLWLSTSFTTDYDETTGNSMIDGMTERGIPLSVFHFDCFWMREFNWTDLLWDARVFPDPAGMLARLHERGLKICVWINPYIAQRSVLFDEAAAEGYLLKRPDGSLWQWDMWQAGMGIVDFSNPAACTWFAEKLRVLLELGVDAFKTDFGERIPTDVVWFDGSDPHKMHNYYSFLYNQTVFNLLKEVRGEGEAVLFARSATAGGQQFPVHWGGDCSATFESMAESLRGGLSLNLSGFGFWSHDIGGFEQASISSGTMSGVREAAVYKRWCAFGLLSSHSRLHGNSSYRVPWLYDEEAVAVLRKFTRLKASLMPYLYQKAIQAHESGLPMLRAMLLEFPDDTACETLDRQYMLGDSLLVAPVFSENGEVTWYAPAGRWTNLLDGKVVDGPRWMKETHDYLSLPLLVRPNSVLPLGLHSDKPEYDYADGLTLQLYELEPDAVIEITIPALAGEPTRFGTTRQGQTIHLERIGPAKAWNVLLVNIPAVSSVSAGEVESTDSGVLLRLSAQVSQVEIQL